MVRLIRESARPFLTESNAVDGLELVKFGREPLALDLAVSVDDGLTGKAPAAGGRLWR